jgi:hypothetical protein
MKDFLPTRNWLSATTQAKPTTPSTVGDVLGDAARRGGLLARWQVRKAVDGAYVELSREAVGVLFYNKREELKHRAALELDRSKKHTIAESLAETATIEKAIVEMTNTVFHELDEMVYANHKVIYGREAARMDELEKSVAAGRMSADRLDDARGRLQVAVSDHLVRVEGMAERLIENLGERWRRTLNGSAGNI